MKTGLWAKEVAEISILLYQKWNGGNSLPTKMGGDFSNLCVALILAFIHIYINVKLAETCLNSCIYSYVSMGNLQRPVKMG